MDYKDTRIKKSIEVLHSFFSVSKLATEFTKRNAEELGITFQQLSIINTLRMNKGITLKKLSEKLSIQLSISSLSLIIEKLVGLKLVEREISDTDRRAVKLKLTDAGIEISKRSQEKAYSYRAMTSALENMKEEDIDTLLRLHNELLGNLKQIEIAK
ncbi:MAG: MarR family winged helix-turn-helix transcriptional regulator [Paraclostridium sp.]|uniref:MarR family winged helix-turn-helix transcriptional regulator n=1 Tax=Paraclostridium sp. TaxID=2023273 RepID=UPI003F2ED990